MFWLSDSIVSRNKPGVLPNKQLATTTLLVALDPNR